MVSFLVCFCFILYLHDFMQYIYFMKSKFFFKPEHVAAFASACISFVRFILPCNQDICSQSLHFCVASFTCSYLYFDFMPFRECRCPFKRCCDAHSSPAALLLFVMDCSYRLSHSDDCSFCIRSSFWNKTCQKGKPFLFCTRCMFMGCII